MMFDYNYPTPAPTCNCGSREPEEQKSPFIGGPVYWCKNCGNSYIVSDFKFEIEYPFTVTRLDEDFYDKVELALRRSKAVLQDIVTKAPGYDWNADPDNLTLMIGYTHEVIDAALKKLPKELWWTI